MPRRPSENTVSITIKMPQAWVDFAQGLADVSNADPSEDLRLAARLSRTDVMRMALEMGLKKLSGGVDPNKDIDWKGEIAAIEAEQARKEKKVALRRRLRR